MDNRQFDIQAEGEKLLYSMIDLLWNGEKATHFVIKKYIEKTTYYDYNDPNIRRHSDHLVEDDENGTPTLILFWNKEKDSQKLPFNLKAESAKGFISGFLKDVDFGKKTRYRWI